MGLSEWMNRKKFGGGFDAIKREQEAPPPKEKEKEGRAYEFLPMPESDLFAKYAMVPAEEYRRRLEYMFGVPRTPEVLPNLKDMTSRDVSACEMSYDAASDSYKFVMTIRNVSQKVGIQINRETMEKIERIAAQRSGGGTYGTRRDFTLSVAIIDVLLAMIAGKQERGGILNRLSHNFVKEVGHKSRCAACGLDFASATQQQMEWCAEMDAAGSVVRWNYEECDDEPDADDPSAWGGDDEEEPDADADQQQEPEPEPEPDREIVVEIKSAKCDECGGCGWTPTKERDAQGFPKEVLCFLCKGKGIREIRRRTETVRSGAMLTCPGCRGGGCAYCMFRGIVRGQ